MNHSGKFSMRNWKFRKLIEAGFKSFGLIETVDAAELGGKSRGPQSR